MKRELTWICLLGLAALVPGEGRVRDRLDEDDAWYGGEEASRVASNVLAWQTEGGGWPKNVDTTASRPEDARPRATFDNGATVGELRFLAKMIAVTGDDRYRAAFEKGLRHILEARYDNGGWPQRHPPGDGYARHITFNDGVMVRLLEFLREVSEDKRYLFVPAELREEARRGVERGIDCILKCQIVIDGKRTAWCAQHDEKDFRPQSARSYELPSLSGSESAGVARFLMELPEPSPPIREAIAGAARWFEEAQIKGIRIVRKDGDRVVVEDPDAPPLWARFYDLESGRPFFAGRDGVKKDSIAQIEAERRNGYAWYGTWGESVARDYRKWQERLRR